jgi:hypothetical protein
MATPRFKTVPADWQHPFGPYRQAPPEYGGEWWYISWTNSHVKMPWEKEGKPLPNEPDPSFVAVFGPRPHLTDPFRGEWEQNLKEWKGAGLPGWISTAELAAATEIYSAWGMGAPAVYPSRYGYSVRWPATGHFEFEGEARSAILTSTHWKVAEYQDFLRGNGLPVPKPHPFLPPALK